MKISRRRFLASSTAGAVAIAGYGKGAETASGKSTDKHVPAPTVTIPDGWELTTPNSEPKVFAEGSTFGIDWTAVGHTNLYENTELRERVEEETLGKVDRELAISFASRIDFFPEYAHFATRFKRDEIDSKIRSKVRSQMENSGVEEITYEGKIQRDGESNPSSYHKWTGEYFIEEVPIENVDIPHVAEDSLTIGGQPLEITAIAGVWKEGTHLLVAGGVYPAETYTEEKNWDVSDSIDLSLRIDTGFRPRAYERNVKSFVDSTKP